MAQNKLVIILCHTVILFLVFQKISATNITEHKNDTVRTLRTMGQNTNVTGTRIMSNHSECRTARRVIKIIYEYYYPAALVTVGLIFGMLLEMQKVVDVCKRPYAPIISVFCNYIFSPLLCLGFAEVFFPDDGVKKQMLFLSGFHLRSVLSICWTLIMDGNIECSIVMSIINTCLYFLVKPLWVESLDTWEPRINENGVIVIINESHTIWNSCFRIAALAIGVGIQYIYPTSKKYAYKCSIWISLIFIISYATFMGAFHLISWFPFSFVDILKMNIAGWILSIMGYLVGFYFALLFKQSDGDIVAIAVESNIPNEALGSTVLPMTIHYIFIRLRSKKTGMMDETNDTGKCGSIDNHV